mmetsp:Transcript_22799/g.53241  ORF Transcript_22799/g.53241 Transcript_22799/m.53241 type:complete len:86 (+) Transcript_22799:951-1208(+)
MRNVLRGYLFHQLLSPDNSGGGTESVEVSTEQVALTGSVTRTSPAEMGEDATTRRLTSPPAGAMPIFEETLIPTESAQVRNLTAS